MLDVLTLQTAQGVVFASCSSIPSVLQVRGKNLSSRHWIKITLEALVKRNSLPNCFSAYLNATLRTDCGLFGYWQIDRFRIQRDWLAWRLTSHLRHTSSSVFLDGAKIPDRPTRFRTKAQLAAISRILISQLNRNKGSTRRCNDLITLMKF